MSDYVGRKPILLIGLFGSSVSMLCFGLSRTFWALVLRWVRLYVLNVQPYSDDIVHCLQPLPLWPLEREYW